MAYFVNQAKGKGHVQLGGSLIGSEDARMQKGFGNITKDVAKGKNFRKSLKKWRKQGGVEFLNKVKTHMGGSQNRKRKSLIKDSDHSISKKRRVSKEAKGIKGAPVRQPQPMQVYRDI